MAGETEEETLAPLWQLAIAEYEKDTKRQLSPDTLATLRGIQSSEELLNRIEASGQAFQDFRNKRSRLWRTLSSFISPLAAVLKIAITPSSVGDGFGVPASAAIGACLYLVKSCENVSNAYDWIEQVFTELQEFSERLDVYAQSRIDTVLQKKVVAILAFVLRVIGRAESLVREHRFRQYLRVTFLGKDEKTKKLVEDLNQLFGSEQRFVLAVTYATAQRIEEKLDDKVAQIEQDVKQVRVSINESQERETGAQIDNRIARTFCNTSAAEDVEETFFRNKRSLLKGTGAWMQHETLFKSWVEHRAMILWIFGGPGAGKSYLSTWLVNQLLHDLPEPQRRGISVAYFFVKENNEVLRDANNILKTLAWQLINQDMQFKQHAAEISKTRAFTITAEDTWENLFLGYYGRAELNPCFASIVIDGLDEATPLTRRTLLGFMKDLVSASRSSKRPAIQFAVIGRTSLRNDVEITRQEKIYYIEISKHKNKEDIDSYIRKRLEEVEVLQEMRKVKHGLKRANKTGAAIKAKILDGADGVFLWAKLLIDTILRKDLGQIESILKEPPGHLDDMIWSVFDRLAKDEELDHGLIRKMLLFCGYAQRPLKFGELDLFLSLPSRKPNLLLWKQTRGKLSSIFELRYPAGYDPDGDEGVEIAGTEVGERLIEEDLGSGDKEREASDGEVDSEAGEFDFSGDADDDYSDDELGTNQDEDDVFSPIADHGLQSKSWGLEREPTDKMIRHLSDSQLKTEIAFCHARIKDYLVRESSPKSRRKPPCPVIPDSDSVHVQITVNCLDVLRLELSLADDSRYLADYPLRYFTLHLENVDRNRISDNEFCYIIEGLHWLFGTERGTECFIKANQDYDQYHSSNDVFYEMWVGTDRHLCMVQEWFRDAKDRCGLSLNLDTAERLWIDSAAYSFDNLLRPLMVTVNRIWLTKSGYDGDDYRDKQEFACWLLHGWLSLVENGFVQQEIQEFEVSSSWESFNILSAERLETLAKWAGLEQNTHWHTCLGWMLMNGQFYNEAISHYTEAIAQDAQAWVAMEGVARIHGEKEEYQLAIDWQMKAIKAIPERIKSISGYLYPRITTWSSKLGNEALAFEAAQNGFNAEPFHMDAQLKYLEALHLRGDSGKIMSTVEWLNSNIMEETGYSWLVRFIISGFDAYRVIGKACRENRQSAWILDIMDEALKRVDQDDRLWIKIWLPHEMAKFRYTWYDNREDEAIKLAEMFLERLGQQTATFQQDYTHRRKWITNKLAQLYFDKATELFRSAQKITSEVSVFADKLKALAVSVDTSFAEDYDGFDFFRKDYPSLLWGRWLRDYKKADEKVWRKCFKVRLLEEMNSLDDDDPANDMDGMASLAVSLFHAGNRSDAAAMLAILFKPLEDKKKRGDKGVNESSDRPRAIAKSSAEGTQAEQQATTELKDATPVLDKEDMSETIGPLEKHMVPSALNIPAQAGRGLSLNVTEEGVMYTCDNCGRDTAEVEEMYFCEVCLNINWCDRCLVMVRNRSIEPGLKEHMCSPNHDAYRAWPIPEEAKGLAADYLEGGIELRREWLVRLRGDWLRAGV